MAMYVGTGKYLRENFPLPAIEKLALHDSTHYIIEAIGAGIQIIPIEALAGHNDYISALRPRLSDTKKIHALERSLLQIGKAYDYSFNFYSDVNYVCSTLVTKAYLPDSIGEEGVHITLTRIGIGITYPPNDLVKKYREEYGTTNQELDFVGFIDSREK
jgi:uncharacterized protein YycO